MSATLAAEPTSTRNVEVILSQLRNLPSLPPVVTRLLRITADEQADARQVTAVIETDPPFAARLLSAVNKASVGAGGDVSSLEKAVLLLGMKAVRNLVLATEVMGIFREADAEPGQECCFDYRAFWKHCLGVGCAAELLAAQVREPIPRDTAFICGLLHDLGKIALCSLMPKSYERVHRLNRARRGNLADVERELIGLDHMVVGRRLCRQWELPGEITSCVWLHHHPPEALPQRQSHARLVQTIRAADVLVREMRLGHSGNYSFGESAKELAAALGIDEAAFEQVRAKLAPQMEQRGALIAADNLSSEKLYLEAIGTANGELFRLNAALTARNRDLESCSRVLEAVGGFSERLRTGDSPGRVCENGAQALRELLRADCAALTSDPDDQGRFQIGYCGEGNGGHETCFVEAHAGADRRAETVTREDGLTGGMNRRSRELLGAEPDWSQSISCEGRTLGTVAVRYSKSEGRLPAAGPHLQILLAEIGTALKHAREHEASEHLAEDLSEANRRLHESQRLLLRQRTLNMIAEMAGGAAHELNNPLAVISGRSQMLRGETEPEKIETGVRIIDEQAHRCSEIVSELLRFACPEKPKPRPTKPAQILEPLTRSLHENGALNAQHIHLRISDPVLPMHIDPKQIALALEALVSNAIEAMPEDHPELHINCEADPADDMMVIAIRDNGRGMSAEVLERAFDPFYSDRPAGRGRGMGLCHAHRMVEINGGRLRLESPPGGGTTALVWLPTTPPDSSS